MTHKRFCWSYLLLTILGSLFVANLAMSYPQKQTPPVQHKKPAAHVSQFRQTKPRSKPKRRRNHKAKKARPVARKARHKQARAKTAPKPPRKPRKPYVNPIPKSPYPRNGSNVALMQTFEKKFTRMLRKWHIPGASIAIMNQDKLVYVRGFGWSDIKRQTAMQPNTLMRVASVSKAITSVAILKLVDMGILKLDDKVFDILGDIEPLPGAKRNPKLHNITIRNLLHMSSGLIPPKGRGHFDPMFGPWSASIKRKLHMSSLPASCLDIARLMSSTKLRYPPGRGYAYSNLDYCLLGLIINKVAHTPYGYEGYEQLVNNILFYPMNIRHMSIASTLRHECKHDESHYYYYLGPVNPNNYRRSTYLPYSDDQVLQKNFANGGWVASAVDLVRFAHDVGAQKLLTPESFEQMLSSPTYAKSTAKRYMAMGWKVRHQGGEKYWIATGSFTGTNSLVMVKPNDLTIAVIFNSRPPAWHLFRQLRPSLSKLLHKI